MLLSFTCFLILYVWYFYTLLRHVTHESIIEGLYCWWITLYRFWAIFIHTFLLEINWNICISFLHFFLYWLLSCFCFNFFQSFILFAYYFVRVTNWRPIICHLLLRLFFIHFLVSRLFRFALLWLTNWRFTLISSSFFLQLGVFLLAKNSWPFDIVFLFHFKRCFFVLTSFIIILTHRS